MKSALKKVLSLMLVAMLLVTAIPFQVSASGISDGSVVDGSIADGSVADGSIEDGSVVGGTAPKSSSVPAGDIEDGSVVDGSTSGTGSFESDPAQTPAANSASHATSTAKDITVMYTGEIDREETVILPVTNETDIKSLIERKLGTNYGSKYYVTVTVDGNLVTDINTATVDDNTKCVVINALIWQVEVVVFNGAAEHEESFKIQRKITELITLNDALLAEAKLTKPADKIIASWSVDEDGDGPLTAQSKPYGTKITPAANMTIRAILTDGPTVPGGTTPGDTTPTSRYIVTFRKTNGDVAKAYYVNAGGKMAEANVVNASKLATPSGYTFEYWICNGRTYSNKDVANATINGDVTFSAVASSNSSGGIIGGGTIGGGSTTLPGDTVVNKKPYDVYLHVYLNQNFEAANLNINIGKDNADGIAADGVVDLYGDVRNLIGKYYSAKNSKGIQLDGLYVAEGNWLGNYSTDSGKSEVIDGIKERRKTREIHLIVSVTNASRRSASNTNYNSTNPKTGDSIVMTVSALGITASALAAAYYVSKKRAVK